MSHHKQLVTRRCRGGRYVTRLLWFCAGLFCVMTLVACSNKSPYKTGLDSPDPDARIKAIRAIDAKDTQNKDQNIRALIQQLDHDDATIRLYAINKLEKITGKRYGYEPYHAPAKRKKAIKSWLQAYPPAPPQSRVVNPEADA